MRLTFSFQHPAALQETCCKPYTTNIEKLQMLAAACCFPAKGLHNHCMATSGRRSLPTLLRRLPQLRALVCSLACSERNAQDKRGENLALHCRTGTASPSAPPSLREIATPAAQPSTHSSSGARMRWYAESRTRVATRGMPSAVSFFQNPQKLRPCQEMPALSQRRK